MATMVTIGVDPQPELLADQSVQKQLQGCIGLACKQIFHAACNQAWPSVSFQGKISLGKYCCFRVTSFVQVLKRKEKTVHTRFA
eukprot:1160373-Pelagomonas_calceolata.AAC.6